MNEKGYNSFSALTVKTHRSALNCKWEYEGRIYQVHCSTLLFKVGLTVNNGALKKLCHTCIPGNENTHPKMKHH